MQEAAASQAAVKEIGLDAAVADVLSKMGGIFTLKGE